jgi:hypothetical protein
MGMADELPYQQAPQVRQLLAERENAKAYGQTTRVEAVDKQLAELGYKTEKQAEKAASAAEERAAAATAKSDDIEAARSAPPEGRTTRARATTDQAKADKKE